MTSTTKTLGVQKVADGIVHDTETTSTKSSTCSMVTRAWLDNDRVHLSIKQQVPLSVLVLGSLDSAADNYSPDDAEHLAHLLLDLAKQARAVQARKPWPGGPLTVTVGGAGSRRG